MAEVQLAIQKAHFVGSKPMTRAAFLKTLGFAGAATFCTGLPATASELLKEDKSKKTLAEGKVYKEGEAVFKGKRIDLVLVGCIVSGGTNGVMIAARFDGQIVENTLTYISEKKGEDYTIEKKSFRLECIRVNENKTAILAIVKKD